MYIYRYCRVYIQELPRKYTVTAVYIQSYYSVHIQELPSSYTGTAAIYIAVLQ